MYLLSLYEVDQFDNPETPRAKKKHRVKAEFRVGGKTHA
jgi:hypothetical protein